MHRFEEPKVMYICSVCQNEIYEGQEYYLIGDYICEDCMNSSRKVAGEEWN